MKPWDPELESRESYDRRRDWCERHRKTQEVDQWLQENPPPAEWRDSRLEWAYTEMPLAPR